MPNEHVTHIKIVAPSVSEASLSKLFESEPSFAGWISSLDENDEIGSIYLYFDEVVSNERAKRLLEAHSISGIAFLGQIAEYTYDRAMRCACG